MATATQAVTFLVYRTAAPTGLTATAVSSSQINLSWNDSAGAAGYKVYRGGTLRATLGNVLSYQNTGLTPGTPYAYTVASYDVAGNTSAQSSSVSATTTANTATVTWTAPTTNSAGLTFDGSSNDRKIAKYRVYYGTNLTAVNGKTSSYQEVAGVASPYSAPARTLTITGLTAGTWYFRVSAFDYAADGVSAGDESLLNTDDPIDFKDI